MTQANIRNFCIIAHIDHGKSTLADRLLEITGTVPKDKLKPQLLDSLALERERGITIKLAPVRMNYTLDATPYTLNLIDTPGHVDFSYEVSRSLAAVEGAVLLVDATQGIQAQTLAHGMAALEQGLVLIPAINKIDLANADIVFCQKQLADAFGFQQEEIVLTSSKTGDGIEELLKTIIKKVPPPSSDTGKPFRALIFDSFFDAYKGVVAEVRVVDGEVPSVQGNIVFLGTQARGEVLEKGIFTPDLSSIETLSAGAIGYIATGIKEADKVRVGDTVALHFETTPLPGYKEAKPMVFVGLYPIDLADFPKVRETLVKFRLSDPAFSFEPEHSDALGAGFRCGFLGLLHAEVVKERLSSEYDLSLVATAPSVVYLVNGEFVSNPSKLPKPEAMKSMKEPWVRLHIFSPQQYIGQIMELVKSKRGVFINMKHFASQVELSYEMPLSEMITGFYDRLKSVSSGFASLDWEFLSFRTTDAVCLDVFVAGERVDALSIIVYRPKAEYLGRILVKRLREVLPRQNFEVAIQAAIGGKVIARETLSAFRKDVTAKLYGGDRTRKDKLLDKQKKGKIRMKKVGRVEIPQEAFLAVLKS